MRAVLIRAAIAVAALFVTVGSVSAAEPLPLVGGTLSAAGDEITVLSQGNVPVHVDMVAESVTLSVSSFDLLPGDTRTLTFTGRAVGSVSATMTALSTSGEAGSATLTLGLEPAKTPAAPPAPWQPFVVLLILAAVGLAIRRLRPWELRIHRTG